VRNYEWQERRKLQAEIFVVIKFIKLQSFSFKTLQVEERMCDKVSYFIVYDLSLWTVYWSNNFQEVDFYLEPDTHLDRQESLHLSWK